MKKVTSLFYFFIQAIVSFLPLILLIIIYLASINSYLIYTFMTLSLILKVALPPLRFYNFNVHRLNYDNDNNLGKEMVPGVFPRRTFLLRLFPLHISPSNAEHARKVHTLM